MSDGTSDGTHAAAPADHRVEQWIARLLQAGVVLATVVVVAGAFGLMAREGRQPVAFAHFTSGPPGLRSVSHILTGAATLDARAVVQLGLVLLIATPVARVAFTLVAFALSRDRLYVVITAFVLALLTYALIGSR